MASLFCGDAEMNGIPSSYKITIWVDDKAVFDKSWNVMLAFKAEKIYPAHGSSRLPDFYLLLLHSHLKKSTCGFGK